MFVIGAVTTVLFVVFSLLFQQQAAELFTAVRSAQIELVLFKFLESLPLSSRFLPRNHAMLTHDSGNFR